MFLKYFCEVVMLMTKVDMTKCLLVVGNESNIIVEGWWRRRSYKEKLEGETWFFVVNGCLPILNLNVTYIK